MFYSAKNVGEKEFTISASHLREIKRELSDVGLKKEISAMYFRKPTPELSKRIANMGLRLTEDNSRLGKFFIQRVAV